MQTGKRDLRLRASQATGRSIVDKETQRMPVYGPKLSSFQCYK